MTKNQSNTTVQSPFETVILTLPSPLTVYDIDWLSIWSERIGRSLAHVDIHRKALNVPPALEDLVNPKVVENISKKCDNSIYSLN